MTFIVSLLVLLTFSTLADSPFIDFINPFSSNSTTTYCSLIALYFPFVLSGVVGVEIVKEAVIDAVNNAKNNNIENAKFYVGDAGEFIINEYNQGVRYDVVIMDPPRKGSSEEFLSILIKFGTIPLTF